MIGRLIAVLLRPRSWPGAARVVYRNLGQRVRSGFGADVAVLATSGMANAILNLIQGIAVARALGPQHYGVVALVMNYPSLLAGFLNVRSSEVSVRYLGEYAVARDSARALAVCRLGHLTEIGIAAAVLLLVACTAGWAERGIVQTTGTASLLIVSAAALVPYSLAPTSSAALMVLSRFRRQAITETAAVAVRTGMILGLVSVGLGVSGVIWGNALGMALHGLLLAAAAASPIRQAWGASWTAAAVGDLAGRRREIFTVFAYNHVRGVVGLFEKQFDLTLVGIIRGPHEAGLYKLAKTLGASVGYVKTPLQAAAFPRVVAAARLESNVPLRRLLSRMTVLAALPIAVAVLLLMPFVPGIVVSTVRPAFGPAATAAQAFMLAAIGGLLVFWLQALYLSKNGIRALTAASVWSATTFMALGWVLLNAYGFTGLAWAFCISELSITLFMAVWAGRTYLSASTSLRSDGLVPRHAIEEARDER